jgi:hypothetical protein
MYVSLGLIQHKWLNENSLDRRKKTTDVAFFVRMI